MKRWKRRLSILLCAMLMIGMMPSGIVQVEAASQIVLTFSDTGITATGSGSGYTVDGTTLTIESAGVYTVTGSCASGAIIVKKELSGVVLILDDLSLSNAATAPIVIRKSGSTTIHLEGTTTLTDNEDASTESSNTDFEGAAIKVKSASTLTICGDGTLNVYGKAKNGIKGAAASNLLVRSGNIQVKEAAKNGIAFDGSITVKGGTLGITASGDGLKAVPDEDSTDTDELAAAAEDANGNVTIDGGSFDIDVSGDGIAAQKSLTINNGTFDIKSMNGYSDSSFNGNSMSCKGLKVSGDLTSVTEEMTLNGGTFAINTPDDAIHSDANIGIYGGTYTIDSGDDGVHSDTYLQLGKSGGYERDPDITINHSYEGLESGTINSYSGRYYVIASDDGMNAGGGSGNGSDPGQGGNDNFNPGGGDFGGGPGGQGGRMRWTPENESVQQSPQMASTSGNYALNLAGGTFYVNCDGDGLDSNGTLTITGGTYTVLSMRGGGDNSPLDSNSTPSISGGTLFGAGGQGMDGNPGVSGQNVKYSSSSFSSGTTIAVKSGGNTVYTEKLTKNVNYIIYTDPTISSSASIGSGTYDSCKSNSWAHNWDSGTTSGTVTTYTCKDCGAVERQSCPAVSADSCGGHESSENSSEEVTAEKYTATFSVDENATIDVYYTQDYTTASETGVTTAIARNGDTGLADVSGDGQINFKVSAKDGYEVDTVTATAGKYKNVKDQGNGIWRITKVTGDLEITVTLKKTSESGAATDEKTTTDENSTSAGENSASTGDSSTSSEENSVSTDKTTDENSTSTESETTAGKTTTTQKTGKVVKAGKASYKISGNTAIFTGTESTAAKVTIPQAIKVNGKTYKVTEIAANALKNNSRVKQLIIGKNVKKVGKNAFLKCKKLKKITIKGNITTVGKSAFKGIKKGAVIRISAANKKYKKMQTKIKNSGAKNVKFKQI